MSREYRDLMTKAGVAALEEKGRGGRGLISGGSRKLQRRLQNRAYGSATWADGRFGSNRAQRAHAANEYLANRTGRNMHGATPPRLKPGGGFRSTRGYR